MIKKLSILILIASGLFFQCGKNGKDGKIFISFDWTLTPDWYDDDNEAVPDSIVQKKAYETEPGDYHFTYSITPGSKPIIVDGIYTLTADEGQKASLFAGGKDGQDITYVLYLLPTGVKLEPQEGRAPLAEPASPIAIRRSRDATTSSPAFFTDASPIYLDRIQNGFTSMAVKYRLLK